MDMFWLKVYIYDQVIDLNIVWVEDFFKNFRY